MTEMTSALHLIRLLVISQTNDRFPILAKML